MSQNFQWGNPYTDPGADNVVDGSVDYYDFHWGAQVRYADSVQRSCTERRRCMWRCGCPDVSDNCPDDSEDCPDPDTGCPDDGEDCPSQGCGCAGGNGGCFANRPRQTDEAAYPILQE